MKRLARGFCMLFLALFLLVPAPVASASSFDPVWPLKDCRTIYGFDKYEGGSFHGLGCVDIAGQADVLAVEEGLVLYAADHGRGDTNKYYSGNGNYVIVLHSNNTVTYYGHFKDSSLKVKTGDKVKRGQVLGTSGKTGSATGNHLHFQARQLNSKGIKLAEAKKPTQRSDGYFFNNLVYSAKESSTYKNACPGSTPIYVFDDWFFDMRSEIKISSKLIKQNQNYAHYTWLKGDVSSSAKVSVITKAAGNITQTNAKLNGSVTKQKGANISSVGIKVGKSASSLKEIYRERVPSSSNNAGSGTGFDMYYDLSGECGYTLTPNTTYYYQCFAIYNGKEYSGGVLSFTTSAASCQHSYDNLGVCKKCKSSYPLNITSLNQTMVIVKDDVPAHTAPYGAATVTRRLYTGNELAITGQAVNHFGNLWFRTSAGDWLVSDYLGSRQAGLSVATKAATGVTATNAVLQGSVSKKKGMNVGDCGFYLGTSLDSLYKTATFDAGAAANAKGGGTGFDIWCDMDTEIGLQLFSDTTYYYQCYAVYNGVEYRGNVQTFRTLSNTPSHSIDPPSPTPASPSLSVTTKAPTGITATNAVLQGSVAKKKGVNVGDCGFYLGSSPSAMRRAVTFDAGAAANAKGGGTGFDIWCDMNTEAQMSLSPSTTYYYQCFAVYNGQEFRGSVCNFTTPSLLTVNTGSVTKITRTNAVLWGSVTKKKGVNIGDCGFYLGSSPSAMRRAVTFDAGAAANAKGGGTGFDIWCDMNAEAQMSLSPGATYYYQCFAVYNGQEFRGSVGSFTTKK